MSKEILMLNTNTKQIIEFIFTSLTENEFMIGNDNINIAKGKHKLSTNLKFNLHQIKRLKTYEV